MGNSFIFIVILIAIIGSIISSIAKSNNKTKKSNTSTNRSVQTRPSAPKTGGGLDLASEIKNQNSQMNEKTAFQKEAEKTAKQKERIYEQKHNHPSSKGNVRVEKVYVENSMGVNQTEGCSEHYYERYVEIDEEPSEKEFNKELAQLIVMGEVLNNPGYKKHRRR